MPTTAAPQTGSPLGQPQLQTWGAHGNWHGGPGIEAETSEAMFAGYQLLSAPGVDVEWTRGREASCDSLQRYVAMTVSPKEAGQRAVLCGLRLLVRVQGGSGRLSACIWC